MSDFEPRRRNPFASHRGGASSRTCCVCQEDIQVGGCRTFGKITPCQHDYHEDCMGGFHYLQSKENDSGDTFVEMQCPQCGVTMDHWHRYSWERDLRSEFLLQEQVAPPSDQDDISTLLKHVRTKLWSPNPKEVAAALRSLVQFATNDIDATMLEDDDDGDDSDDDRRSHDTMDEEEEKDENLIDESFQVGFHIVLIRLLERFHDSQEICDMTMGLLEWMTGGVGRASANSHTLEVFVRFPSGIQTILTTLKTFLEPSSRSIVYNGLATLQKLCQSKEARQAIYSAGGVDMSFAVLQKFKGDFTIQEMCVALMNLFTRDTPYATSAVGRYPQAAHWLSLYLEELLKVSAEDDEDNEEDDYNEVDRTTLMTVGELMFRLAESTPVFATMLCQGIGAKYVGLLYKKFKDSDPAVHQVYGQLLRILYNSRMALMQQQQQQEQQAQEVPTQQSQQQQQQQEQPASPLLNLQAHHTAIPAQTLVEQAGTLKGDDQMSALKRGTSEVPPTPPYQQVP